MSATSEAKTKANRENAKKSTGPKTENGKRRVGLNPVTHGFAGQTCFIPDHQREAYNHHFEKFRAAYLPKGPTEEFMVQSLAELSWSSQQIRALSTNLMALLGTQPTPFPSADAANDFAMAQAANVSQHIKDINLLGIYEQRKTRLFNTTLNQLQQLQSTRKEAEKEELAEAATFRQRSPKTWQPAHDGFACSLPEIDRYINRANRLNQLLKGQKMAS
jgi:hypothetical protein